MTDIKRRYEQAISDALLRALSIDAVFVRPGDDDREPDMIYTVQDGKTLGVEVATA